MGHVRGGGKKFTVTMKARFSNGALAIGVTALSCQIKTSPQKVAGCGVNFERARLVEVTRFSLADGVERGSFLAEVNQMNDGFLARQSGFVYRSLTHENDSAWPAILLGESGAPPKQAIRHPETDSAGAAFLLMNAPAKVQLQRCEVVGTVIGYPQTHTAKDVPL